MPKGSIDAANANVEAGTFGDSVMNRKNVADVSRGRGRGQRTVKADCNAPARFVGRR